MSYKNYNWEVAAHDYKSPYLRNSLWTLSFFKYMSLLGVSRPVLGITSRNNQIEYITDFSTWLKTHEELKAQVLENYNNFDNLINKSVEHGEKMNIWTEKNVFNKDLTVLAPQDLVILLKEFIDLQESEYTYGSALPILDFANFSFVEGNLNRYLKEKVPEKKFQEYYSVFTEPIYNSFSQDQEEDLLKLLETFNGDANWVQDVKSLSFDEVKDKHGEYYLKLSRHTKKYAWVYYVYIGPAFSEKQFHEFIVDYVKDEIDPREKLNSLEGKKSSNIKLKEQYFNELKPQGIDRYILEIAGKVVWAKPRRKDYQSKSYYHMEKLCREIAKRLFISLDQVRSAPLETIEKALLGENVDWSIANNIKNFHICLPNDNGTITTLTGDEAEEFSKEHVKRREVEQDLSKITELNGTIACVGKVVGIVKIINVSEEMNKMEQGNILVSTATTPSIVPAMKKAAAIITDEGGLTCHAAIVSRELNTPCIVGLKVATKFVKDGDKIEVDANKGIVKILERKCV
jgi:phosphohistidine swiveling domain-containing protein